MNQQIRFRIFLTAALLSIFLAITSGAASAQCNPGKSLAPLLDTLTVSGETLSPSLDPNNLCYSLSVVNSTGGSGRFITITVHSDKPATLSLRDFSDKSIALQQGQPADIFVPNGTSNLSISAVDSVSSQGNTYSIAVNVAAPTIVGNTDLQQLSAAGQTLFPAFSPGTTSYALSSILSGKVTSMTVSAVPADLAATMQVSINDGPPVGLQPGAESTPLPLIGGSNTIAITVNVLGSSKMYTILVSVAESESLQGPAGPQGPPGDPGPAGPAGTKGDPGDKGDPGEPGVPGPKGDTGLTGSNGETGPKGEKGDQGIPGPKGDTGPAGAKGDTGANGQTGPEGRQGLTGPSGAPGVPGPQGDTGATGPQGPTGATGPQGAVGPTGPQGAEGPRGSTGAQGPQGAPGPSGPSGPQGPQGAPGLSGVQRLASTPVTLLPQSSATALATCPGGRTAIGGGANTSVPATSSAQTNNLSVSASFSDSPTTWTVTAFNSATASAKKDASLLLTVHVICAIVQ